MTTPPSRPSRVRRLGLAFVVLVLVAAAVPAAQRHLLSAALLLRFGGETTGLAAYERARLTTVRGTFEFGGSRLAFRTYHPRGTVRGRLLLVHGMHRLGIDEPRLVALARNLAQTGLVVTTPEIAPLTQYRLDRASVDAIEAAACAAAHAHGRERIAVLGISFAGGLATLAAGREHGTRCIGAVVAIGAHGDLARVTRWFAGDPARGPRGEGTSATPHPYGAQLLMYDEPARFFSPADVAVARELLRLSLHDDWRSARARAGELSPGGRALLELAFVGGRDPRIAAPLRRMADERGEDLATLSPERSVGARRVPTLLLHGADDPIVPSTESLWLGRALGDATVLVTRALRHAEGAEDASFGERAALVRFFADVLRVADEVE